MTYHIFKGQRPILAALFFLTALTAVLSSCQKPENEVGIGVQPEEDNINLNSTDTTTLQMVTLKDDPVRTDESGVIGSMLGNHIDPILGSVKTSIFTQLQLSTNNVDFGDISNIEPISLDLNLVMTGEMSGQIVPQSFSVQEIMEPMSRDSSYKSDTDLQVAENNLIAPDFITQSVDPESYTIIEGDTVHLLQFKLTNELIQKLLDASGTEDLQNNDNFTQYIKGIRISSTTEDANTLEFSLRDNYTNMVFKYHDLGSENPDDTLTLELAIDANRAFFTKVEHDYTGTQLEPLQNGQDSISGSDRLYVQSQGGVKTKIDFPNIMDYASPPTRIINRAELIIPVEEGTDDPYYPIIKMVPTTDYNDVEDQFQIIDFLAPTSPDFVNMLYDPEDREYNFNITRHIQGLLEGTVENSAIYLVPEHPRFGTSEDVINVPFDVRRSVINGLDDEENPPRLVLTFTD